MSTVWQRLGLPGLVDVHVHVLPPNVERKVWAFFAKADRHYGRSWPIAYAWPLEERRAELRRLGVRAYPGLVYPHKVDMAEWLTDWALEYAAATPEVVPSATFYPEPGAPAYVERAIERGARVFKAHVQVGGYDPRDPLLDSVWGLLAEAQFPVVTHCGDGPIPGPHTGVGPICEVMARHPRLRLVVAHAGMPRYADFLDLAAAYPSVVLDTTMAFTPYVEETMPFPRERLAELHDLGLAGRVVLGSDFPSIPTPTTSSWTPWCGSTWGMTGCGRCCGARQPICSVSATDYGWAWEYNVRHGRPVQPHVGQRRRQAGSGRSVRRAHGAAVAAVWEDRDGHMREIITKPYGSAESQVRSSHSEPL